MDSFLLLTSTNTSSDTNKTHLSATVQTVSADLIVQTCVENRRPNSSSNPIDYRRAATFTAFGFGYNGVAQYMIYVKLFRRLWCKKVMDRFCNATFSQKLKDRAGQRQVLQQIGLDFLLIQPVIYWPSYYFCKTLTLEPSARPKDSLISSSWTIYRPNMYEDNVGMCAFWLPMDLVIYSLPIHLRMHATHGIAFAWVGVVSLFRGGEH